MVWRLDDAVRVGAVDCFCLSDVEYSYLLEFVFVCFCK